MLNEANILAAISTVAQTPPRPKMLMKPLMKDQCITPCGREEESDFETNFTKYYIKTSTGRELCGTRTKKKKKSMTFTISEL